MPFIRSYASGGGGSAGAMAIDGSVTSGTQGSVLFLGASGVLAQDNAAFFYDAANDALGIGTATPNTNGKLSVHPDTDVFVVLGRLKMGATSGAADHVYLSHFDLATSATTYQIRLDPDGDTTLQAVGNQTVGINTTGGTGTVAIQINSVNRIVCNGTGIGFFATTPTARNTGWTTFTNLSVDKTCDADTVVVAELADIVGTLIEELKAKGLIAA